MSMELMVKAMKTKVGSPLRKLVLIKLADNANDQGECWPSYKYIADQCEMSRRSVMLHIDTLCKAGLVLKEIRHGGPKGNSSNIYILRLAGGANAAPPGESDALGGGESPAPRTSHSFEPVIEPKPLSKLEGFEQFWKLYPRKVNKAKAGKAWEKLAPNSELTRVINQALARQATSLDWLKSGGQFVPHPTTWLTGRRWEDELAPASLAGKSRHTNLDQIDHTAGLEMDENGNYRISGSGQ
jgi:hypothetical protein